MTKLFECPRDNEKIAEIMKRIEYTALLSLNATKADVQKTCKDAIKYNMGFFVPFQVYLKDVIEALRGTPVKIVQGCTDIFLKEERLNIIREGLQAGCHEVDIVADLSLFFDKKYDKYQQDVNDIYRLVASYNVPLKVIIETGYLTDSQKLHIAQLSLDSGATFIKTCMGMRAGRGTIHDILLLKNAFKDRIKIKASGGIASLEDAYAMIEAGADRVALRGLAVEQMEAIGYLA